MTAITHPDTTTTRRTSRRTRSGRAFERATTGLRRLRDRIADAAASWQLGGDPETEIGRRTGARI